MTVIYHESSSELSSTTRDIHRGIATLVEEWEAIDWYQQRLDVTDDDELRSILEHNRNEEMEHGAMALEWLRRRIPELDEQLRTYLFTDVAIVEAEQVSKKAESGSSGPSDLGIGKLDS